MLIVIIAVDTLSQPLELELKKLGKPRYDCVPFARLIPFVLKLQPNPKTFGLLITAK